MIELACFVAGVVVGVVGSLSSIMFLGDREIRKRRNRATDWQKIKKQVDKENIDEYGI